MGSGLRVLLGMNLVWEDFKYHKLHLVIRSVVCDTHYTETEEEDMYFIHSRRQWTREYRT